MKKYCLTKCFKRKLSKGWENTIEVSIIMGIVILGLIIIGIIFTGIGYAAVEWLGFDLPEKASYGELGFFITVMTAAASWTSYYLFKFAMFSSKKTSSFIKDRYEGKEFECQIFEECKTEPDE